MGGGKDQYAAGANGDDQVLATKKGTAGYTMAQRMQLVQGAGGIYLFFVMHGKLQERIFLYRSRAGKKFTAVWLLQLLEALANVLVGSIGRHLYGFQPGLPQQQLMCAGITQVFSKYCLSLSLVSGLSFPVATLAKSAKMVPVMLGSLILGGKTFSARKVSQAVAIVGGTSLVTLSESSGGNGKRSTIKGLLLVAAALAGDGIVGGVQQRLKVHCKQEKLKLLPYDMMFWSNFYMGVAALVAGLASSELRQGLNFCRGNPELSRLVTKYAFCGAMGQAFIFYTIAKFDSVVCTAITTTRKLVSVLLSLQDGDKAGLQPLGWAGIGIASAGIIGEAV